MSAPPPAATSHAHAPDPRNQSVLVYVNGALVPRAEARVSVFDSGFLLGDGIWESFRVHDGKPAFLALHLDRLFAGAKALDLDIGMSRAEIAAAIDRTLAANGMRDGVHVRLMITRGERSTPYQDPRVCTAGPTVVIIAEHKVAAASVQRDGLRLYTVYVRRGSPDVQDPRLHSHAKLNCILACIQATKAGADEGLMLDPHGFVATCNSTHFFIVRRGEVWTSTGRYCLAGITRGNVIALCREHGLPVHERDFSLIDVYSADEAFVTGTFAGIVPVSEVDGRRIGEPAVRPLVRRLQTLYQAMLEADVS